jgi:hypothetical protein
LFEWLKRRLTRRTAAEAPGDRRIRLIEDIPSDGYVLAVALMITFFIGLIGLEVAHMLVFQQWNESIFNGVMLVVGTIVGAVYGRNTQ